MYRQRDSDFAKFFGCMNEVSKKVTFTKVKYRKFKESWNFDTKSEIRVLLKTFTKT